MDWIQLTGCCEDGNELSGSIKDGEFTDQQSNCQLLKTFIFRILCSYNLCSLQVVVKCATDRPACILDTNIRKHPVHVNVSDLHETFVTCEYKPALARKVVNVLAVIGSQSVSQPVSLSVSSSISRSVSQSVCRSVSRSASQSVGQSVGQSASQSVGQSASQSVGQSVGQPVSLSVSRPVSLSVSQSVGQPVSLSVSRPVSLSVSQSVSQSVCRSVGQSVCRSASQPD
jgi:hypothetical protein